MSNNRDIPVLRARNLGISYGDTQAVRGFSLDVRPGEIVGLVGESGSGKSSVLRAAAGLLGASGRVDKGDVLFCGESVVAASRKRMAQLRGAGIAYVFQDAVASLDPLARIGTQFDECLRAHKETRGKAVRELERAMLSDMGFDDADRVLASFPHELSGGMCQRVVLAMSAALAPKLMLADEPTSALDVASQSQVLDLLARLRDESGCAMLVVTHNIAAVSRIADRIGVMRSGELVELGQRDQVLHAPEHEYTRELIAAIPRATGKLPGVSRNGENV